MLQTCSIVHDRKYLEFVIKENISVKQKIASYCTLPFHRIATTFNTFSSQEITILFQSGILSNRIFVPKQSLFDLDKYQVHFASGAVQFLQRLLERRLVAHDVRLLVKNNEGRYVLKPVMYEHRQTLDYLLLHKLANPDVTDSEGCPVYLDEWRQVETNGPNLIKIHKLLTLGAKGLGANTHGENMLHFIASGRLPWSTMKSVVRYFVKREHLQTLASQNNCNGMNPFHILVRYAFKDAFAGDEMVVNEITDFMLGLGADINAPISPSGLTVLHLIILNYNNKNVDIVPENWALHMTPHLRILPDASGVTPLALAMYYRRKHLLQYILNNIDLGVQDVLSRHSVIIPYLHQLIPFYEKHHRKALLLRIKHGLRHDACQEAPCLPENMIPFQDRNLVDDGLTLTLDNIKAYSSLKSPWFLDYMTAQLEALLIRTVNKTLHPSTLHYFLSSYLDSLNAGFTLPTDRVTEHNYMSDFNFQLSKHLCRITRAMGHLRYKYSLSDFIDKFFEFLDKKLLPLIGRKLSPSDINAVRAGYIDHFVQDVVYQINIVLSLWYNQLCDQERAHARNRIKPVWNRIQFSPNSQLTVFGMFVAAVVTMRVKIHVELKFNPFDVLQLFKEMSVNLNTRMVPTHYTPLAWIVMLDKRRKRQTFDLLVKLCELGVYIYARDENGKNVIDLARMHAHPSYKTWGSGLYMVPKPLTTLCSECIIDNGVSLKSIGTCRYLVDFVKLHGLPKLVDLETHDEKLLLLAQ